MTPEERARGRFERAMGGTVDTPERELLMRKSLTYQSALLAEYRRDLGAAMLKTPPLRAVHRIVAWLVRVLPTGRGSRE